MRIAIIVSSIDLAGMNIASCLKKVLPLSPSGSFGTHPVLSADLHLHQVSLYITDVDSVNCESIDKNIEADLFIFATKHVSKSGIPSLSCHAPGNWGKAILGGSDKTLCIVPALWLRQAYLAIVRNCPSGFDPVMEATHHGPLLEKPCLFMEIGSTEMQWQDSVAGEAIAKSISEILHDSFSSAHVCVALGGLHTCPSFNRAVQNNDVAVGHVCSKQNLEFLSAEMLKHALHQTLEPVDFVLVDWKGLGPHKDRVAQLCRDLGLFMIRTDRLSKG